MFLMYTDATLYEDDCFIPTSHGPQALPRWVVDPKNKTSLVRLSHSSMLSELRADSKEAYVLLPKPTWMLLASKDDLPPKPVPGD
eukprot:1066920-Rhodomonas_salina.1